MKKRIVILSALMTMMFSPFTLFAEEAPAKVKDIAHSILEDFGKDPVIIAAVKIENAKNKTLDAIKAEDQTWRNTPGIDVFMKSILESDCAKHLRNIQASKPYFSEIFVMDNQGANVAMTDKTSDYWQGDEDKFTQTYNNGKGSVFIDQVEFDDSSQTYLVQVSVPVMSDGTCIGAITFGVDVDKIEN
jgi:hypothetical protein